MMRWIPLLFSLMVFVSCNEQTQFKFSGDVFGKPNAQFNRDTFGIKKTEQLSLTFRMKQWDWPWLSYGCWFGYSTELSGWSGNPIQVVIPPPDSSGNLSVDSTRFYDESLTYEVNNQYWYVPDSVFKGNNREWVHAIYNSGTLPIYIDSVVTIYPNVKVICPTGELTPSQTANLRFSVQTMTQGPAEYKFAVYYSCAHRYVNSIVYYTNEVAYIAYRTNYYY